MFSPGDSVCTVVPCLYKITFIAIFDLVIAVLQSFLVPYFYNVTRLPATAASVSRPTALEKIS